MKISNIKNLSLVPVCMLAVILSACGATDVKQRQQSSEVSSNKHIYSGSENAVTKMSENNKYKVTLYSNKYPLKTGEIHDWIVQVLTPDNKPIENIKIYVHGGMPVHRHGFPTNPRVTESLGEGRYLISGVKFSMPGDWEMRLNIKEPTKRDRAIFYIEI